MTAEQKKIVRTFLDANHHIVAESNEDRWTFTRFAIQTVTHPDYDNKPFHSIYNIKGTGPAFNIKDPSNSQIDWDDSNLKGVKGKIHTTDESDGTPNKEQLWEEVKLPELTPGMRKIIDALVTPKRSAEDIYKEFKAFRDNIK